MIKYVPLALLVVGCGDHVECTGSYRLDIVGLPQGIEEFSLLVEFEGRTVELFCSESSAEFSSDTQLQCGTPEDPWGLELVIDFGNAASVFFTHRDGVHAPHGPYRVVLSSPMDPGFEEEYVSTFMVGTYHGCEEGAEIWEL